MNGGGTTMASTMSKGTKAMAERMVRAEESFLDVLVDLGGISRDEAERVLAYYRKHRLVKMDAVNGRMDVSNGAFLERDVIRRAVTA